MFSGTQGLRWTVGVVGVLGPTRMRYRTGIKPIQMAPVDGEVTD